MKLPPALTKNVKGVPVYVWLLLLIGAIALGLYFRRTRALENEAALEDLPEDYTEEGGFIPYPGHPSATNNADSGEIGYDDLNSLSDALTSGFADLTGELLGLRTEMDERSFAGELEHADLMDSLDEIANKKTKVVNKIGKKVIRAERVNVKRGKVKGKRVAVKKGKIIKPKSVTVKKQVKRVALTGGNPPRSNVKRIDTKAIGANLMRSNVSSPEKKQRKKRRVAA